MDHFLGSRKFIQKWCKNASKMVSRGPVRMDPKMIPEWTQNGAQNGLKMDPKCIKKNSKSHQNLFENYSKCNQNLIKMISKSIKIQSIMNPSAQVSILVPAT